MTKDFAFTYSVTHRYLQPFVPSDMLQYVSRHAYFSFNIGKQKCHQLISKLSGNWF